MQLAILIISIYILSLTQANAVMVEIDTGNYTGTYKINGTSQNEIHTYDLDTSLTHTFSIAPGLSTTLSFNETGGLISAKPDAISVIAKNKLLLKTIPVRINKADYQGRYWIPGVMKHGDFVYNDVETVNLLPTLGKYQIAFAPSNSFRFSIGKNGFVTPESEFTATGSQNSLELKTTSINIDVSNFLGKWWIVGALPAKPPFYGNMTLNLTPDVKGYEFAFSTSNSFKFNTNKDGTVDLSETNAAKSIYNGRSLKLNTVPVYIDVGKYNGVWWIDGAPDRFHSTRGSSFVNLVPDVIGYNLAFAPSNSFKFDIDKNGKPDTSKTKAADTIKSPDGIHLNTTSLKFDTGKYAGHWWLTGATNSKPPFVGSTSIDIVRDVKDYAFSFGSGSSFFFNVDGNGTVSFPKNKLSAIATTEGLRLNAVPIKVTPEDLTLGWRIHAAEPRISKQGIREVYLVPGVPKWRLQVLGNGGSGFFDLDQQGVPTPSSLRIRNNGTEIKFGLQRLGEFSRCDFSTNLIMQTDLDGQIQKGDLVTAKGDIEVNLKNLSSDDFIKFFFWHGSIALSHKDGGQTLVSKQGRIEFLNLPNRSAINLFLENTNGGLGQTPITGSNAMTLELNGDAVLLSALQFQPKLSEWNRFQTSRIAHFSTFSNLTKATIGSFTGADCTGFYQ